MKWVRINEIWYQASLCEAVSILGFGNLGELAPG